MKVTTDQINRTAIQCPFCDNTYHHVARVGTELDPSGDEIEVYEGTSLVFERQSTERRSAVRVDFRGECGHFWSLILQQHKGVMEVYARAMEAPLRNRDEWEENRPIEMLLSMSAA
jgi:hypothetical protein